MLCEIDVIFVYHIPSRWGWYNFNTNWQFDGGSPRLYVRLLQVKTRKQNLNENNMLAVYSIGAENCYLKNKEAS